MGWNVRISSALQPAGAASFPPPEQLLLPDTRLYGASSTLALAFQTISTRLFHLLHLLTRFIHRTVFCRWDYDVFILHTTRRPAPPGERPRAQPVVAAGFEPACRRHAGGTRNTDQGGT